MPLSPGTRLGNYEIEAPVDAENGRDVYRGRDIRLDRAVAIELLAPSYVASSDFEREARVLSRLRHPRIASLVDVGETDGARYVVCEWVEGRTLAARLREGALPLAEALEHCLEIAEALDGGHRQGIAHGSLTAAEVVLTDRGARLRGYGRGRLTRATAGEGETAGRDIAALGAIVSEMLGERGSADGAPPLEPPRLDRALARCLATDPAESWASASELAAELRRVREERSSWPAPPAPTRFGASAREEIASRSTTRRWVVLALMGAALATVVLAIAALR